MARMEATVTIARPVEEVFRFFLALDENAPKVEPGGGSVVKSPEGPPGLGRRSGSVSRRPGRSGRRQRGSRG
jgi:hypothetical protein